MMTGVAKSWQRGNNLILEEKGREVTWSLFKEVFMEKYFPKLSVNEKERKFNNLRQGSLYVRDYTQKFELLLKYYEFYPLHPNHEWICEKFQEGIRYYIHMDVLFLHIDRFNKLSEFCLQIEMIYNWRNQHGSRGSIRNHNSQGNFNRGQEERQQHCGIRIDPLDPCLKPQQRLCLKPTPPQKYVVGRCYMKHFSCGITHLNRDYPTLSIVNSRKTSRRRSMLTTSQRSRVCYRFDYRNQTNFYISP